MEQEVETLKQKLHRLETLKLSLDDQDAILLELGPKHEVSVAGARPLLHIFGKIRSEFPDLVPAFEFYAQPSVLRVQIRLARGELGTKIQEIGHKLDDFERADEVSVTHDTALEILQQRTAEGDSIVSDSDLEDSLVATFEIWTDRTVASLRRIFSSSWHADRFEVTTTTGYSSELTPISVRDWLCPKGLNYLKDIQERIFLAHAATKPTGSYAGGNKVFIGHGRSSVWKDLRDFVNERLRLPWDEFNRVPVAGISNVDRLSEMLDSALIAFIVLTAEDEQADGKLPG